MWDERVVLGTRRSPLVILSRRPIVSLQVVWLRPDRVASLLELIDSFLHRSVNHFESIP